MASNQKPSARTSRAQKTYTSDKKYGIKGSVTQGGNLGTSLKSKQSDSSISAPPRTGFIQKRSF